MNEISETERSAFSTLISILSLKQETQIPEINESFSLFVSNISFPSYSFQDIQLISERIKHGTTYCEVLQGFEYYFPLIPSLLQLISEILQPLDNVSDYFCSLVSYSYVTWRMYVEKTDDFGLLPILLEAISSVAVKTTNILPTTVYVQSVEFYIRNCKEIDIDSVFVSFSEMIQSKKEVSSRVQCLILTFLDYFIPGVGLNLSQKAEYLLDLIYDLEKSNLLLPQTKSAIEEKICVFASKMNISALNLFALLAPCASQESAATILSSFPHSVFTFFGNNKNCSFHANFNETDMKLPVLHSYSQSLQFVDKETFTDFDINQNFSFSKPEFGHFLSSETKFIIDSVVKIADIFKDEAVEMFKCFNLTITKHNIINEKPWFIAAYIYINHVAKLSNELLADFVVSTIQSSLFTENYSVFDEDNQNSELLTLRLEFFNVLAEKQFFGIQNILENCFEKPLILGESIIFILSLFDKIPQETLNNPIFIRNITNAASMFAKLHSIVTEEKSRKFITKTRTALFVGIKKVLSNQNNANIWLSNPVFMSYFMTMLFEEPVRPFAIEELKKYISNKSDAFSSPLVSSIISSIEILTMHFPSTQHVELAIQLLMMTNSILEQNKNLSSLFTEIIDCTITSLNFLDANIELDFQFIEQELILLKNMKEKLALTQPKLTSIESTILKITKKENIDTINDILFDIFLDQNDKNAISYPCIFQTLYKFQKANYDINNFIKKLQELSKYSIANCWALSKNNVDTFLLGVIKAQYNSKEVQQNVLDVIDVVMSISTFGSSKEVASSISDMLCPIKGKSLSVYYSALVNKIYDAVRNNEKIPNNMFCMNTSKPAFTLFGIPLYLSDVPIRITFYIFNESQSVISNISCTLFEFRRSKKQIISIALDNGKLNIISNNVKKVVEHPFVPFQETFFMIDIYKGYFNVLIDDDEFSDIKSDLLRENSKYDIRVGQNKSENAKMFPLLSMFKITYEEKVLFNFNLSTKPATCNTTFSSNNFKVNKLIEDPFHIYSLSNAFVDFYEGLPLTVLFAQLDYKDHNKNCINDIALTGIYIFIILFRTSFRMQENFLSNHLSNILAHLLSVTDSRHLTFELYLAIYELAKEAKNNVLKLKIIKKLMLDITIWIRSSGKTISQITTHWLRAIFPQYNSSFKSLFTINSLLLALKEYCAITKSDDDEKYSQQTIQNLKDLMIAKYNSERFSPETLILFFSQCILSSVNEHVKLFISIINIILKTTKEPKENLQKVGKYVPLLHSLLSTKDKDILLGIINIIHLSHKLEMITDITIEQHVFIIMDSINVKLMNADILEEIIKIVNSDIPEILPLCCSIAVSLGREYVDKTIDSLNFENLQTLNITSFALFWICTMFGNASNAQKRKLSLLLFNERISMFKSVCSMMQVVELVMNIPQMELLHPLFVIVIESLNENIKKYSIDQYLGILSVIYINILFQTNGRLNMQLQEMFADSPFEIEKEDHESIKSISVNEIQRKLKELLEKDFDLNFGLRFESMKWSDLFVAQQIIEVFEMYPHSSLFNYDFVITSFLLNYDKACVANHMKNIPPLFVKSNVNPQLMQYYMCTQNKTLKIHDYLSPVWQFLPNERTPKQIAHFLVTEIEQSLNIQQEISAENSIINAVEKSNHEFVSKSRTERMKNIDYWIDLWYKMTKPFAPWVLKKEFGPEINRRLKLNYVFALSNLCPFSICSSRDFHETILIEKKKPSISIPLTANSVKCSLIKFRGSVPATLTFINSAFSIRFEGTTDIKRIPLSKIRRIEMKMYKNIEYAMEIQTKSCKSIFILLDTSSFERIEEIIKEVSRITDFPILTIEDQRKQLKKKTEMWVNGELSNFDYILSINFCSGKSFCTLDNYPIFPLVINDCNSAKLDFDAEETYFDITKNIKGKELTREKVVFFLQRLEPYTTEWIKTEKAECFKSIKALVESNQCLIIPQFYYLQEFLTNVNFSELFKDVELPSFCFNSIEFVYLNRKLLESDFISSKLNIWIDNNFGINSMNPVFLESHPKKTIRNAPAVGEKHEMSLSSGIINACFVENDKIIKGTVALINGKIINATINLDKSSVSSETKATYFVTDKKIFQTSISNLERFGVVLEKEQIVLTNWGQIQYTGEVNNFAIDDKWICLSMNNGLVNVFCETKFMYDIKMKVQSQCVAISPNFDLLLIGTQSSSLLFLSLAKGSALHKVETSAKPQKIIVSQKWGLVVVLCQFGNSFILTLYNVNGFFITSVPFPSNIDAWCTFTTRSGFENLVACCENGEIYIFELQKLVIGEPIYSGYTGVTSVSYVSLKSSIFITTIDGKIINLPIDLPQ